MRTLLFGCIFTGILTALASAQVSDPQFSPLRRAHVPDVSGATDFAVGDWDGDGQDDVLYLSYEKLTLCQLVESSVLAVTAEHRVPDSYALSLADVDGDGDLDALLWYRLITWVPNENGRFGTPVWIPGVDTTSSRAVCTGDFTGDGVLDLLVTSMISSSRVYVGLGNGRFQSSSNSIYTSVFGGPLWSVAGDFDGDGDLDAVLGDNLLANDGRGNLSVVAQAIPTSLRSKLSRTPLRAVDMDGDGDLDLVGAAPDVDPGAVHQARNIGGRFIDASSPAVERSRGFADIGDLDGDGDVDAVLVFRDASLQVVLNDGSGNLSLGSRTAIIPGRSGRPVALLDTDGDTDLDVATESLLLNDGTGTLQETRRGPLRAFGAPLPTGNWMVPFDLESDGDTDVITRVSILRNRGDGTFDELPTPAALGWAFDVVAGDFDGDGDDDLFAVAHLPFLSPAPGAVIRNDGRGNFTPLLITSPAVSLYRLPVVFDADGDGDAEVVMQFAPPGGGPIQTALLQDTGTGFTVQPFGPLRPQIVPLAIGDVDRDGDDDLVLANGSALELWQNDGTGAFTVVPGVFPTGLGDAWSLHLVDTDQDGDPELLHADRAGLRILVNEPTGSFAWISFDVFLASDISGVRVVDVDEDGQEEILVESIAVGFEILSIEPSLVRRHAVSESSPKVQAHADLDGDGDLDLVTYDGLWWNLRRHAHAPRVAALGQPFRVEAIAASRGFMQALMVLAPPLAAPVPTSAGPLWLDPAGLYAISNLTWMGGPFTRSTWELTIPATPSLAGIEIGAQAALLPLHGTLELTNLRREVVLR